MNYALDETNSNKYSKYAIVIIIHLRLDFVYAQLSLDQSLNIINLGNHLII